MPSREIYLPFPLRGLTKNRGYQAFDKDSTRDALNVTPDDSEEARARGGSRPGLTKRYTTKLESEPLYMIRVSGGTSSDIFEYIIVGTAANIYIGQSSASGAVPPINYSEDLTPLTGNLVTQTGDQLIDQANSDLFVIDTFGVDGVDRANVLQYKDKVILGSDGGGPSSGSALTGTDGFINSSGEFDDVANNDWSALGVTAEQHYLEITADAQTPNEVYLGTYAITSVSATVITPTANPRVSSGATTSNSLTYRIVNGVRDLDPNVPSISTLEPNSTIRSAAGRAVGGLVPVGTDAVVSYRDRLVWATGRTWNMSRQGDPGDYDYAASIEDPTRAIEGATGGPGEPADPIVALVTPSYDYLVMFSESSTWIMRGDPGYQGQLFPLSTVYGCVSARAWAIGITTEIYFLAKDGLYVMAPDAGPINPLSPNSLPRELRELDRNNNWISLAYDPEDGGILIFVVPKTGDTGTHYWYDIGTQSFWPFQLTLDSQQPIEVITFGGNPLRSRRVVLACFDGYLREWTGNDDDGSMISSYVVMGPYRGSESPSLDGIFAELVAILDEDSSSITVEVYSGTSGEEAVDLAKAGTSPDYSFTAVAGRSVTEHPRVRGAAFCVRLVGSGVWAFEGLFGRLADGGKVRNF